MSRSNFKVEFDSEALKRAMLETAEKFVEEEGIEYECPECGTSYKIKTGENPCPSCGFVIVVGMGEPEL